jgi:PTS system nitrogen regulatory IIA component
MRGMVDIKRLIERGGVYFNVKGENPDAAIADAIESIHLPPEISRETLKNAVLEREALMPTAIGNGISFPHPRNPIIAREELQRIVVCFLKSPVNYRALDKKNVFVLFFIISATPKYHLQILSQLSYLCRMESFQDLLRQKPSKEEIVEFIERAEKTWV